MARALSQDLRDRVISSIEAGLSCRAAAGRFGIGVATAVRWRQMALTTGRAVAGKPGGDRRSAKMDDHADFLLGLVAERGDITLAEMQTAMAERGSPVGMGTLWRFFDRRGIAQHTYWSVGRGLADARGRGKTLLRLRVVMDEGGWTLTPGTVQGNPPLPTPDRLRTALGLLLECGRL